MMFCRLVVLLVVSLSALIGHAAETPPLILISMDGFRWDYCALHPAETPNLRRLISEGVTAKGLIPVYPTNTFPNHYTIVTGLYPSHHGIVNNLCFDPGLGEFFRYNRAASARDNRWWGGEPIWATAVKQGRASACSFWPGSEAEIAGVRPTYWKPYNYDGITFEKRLDELVGWLKQPASQRPAVTTFYLEETNAAGHKHEPDSAQVTAAIKLLDSRIGALIARLAAEGIAPNLVIVSDHGMASCDAERVIILDDYLDLKKIQIDFDETSAGLRPAGGSTTASLMEALAKIPAQQGKAYLASDLPSRFHIDPRNPRVPPVWIVPAEGYQVFRRSLYNTALSNFLKGQHGYDNGLESMRGIFIAHGPAFKTGVVIEPVENVHIYNLMCAALALTPAKNDGDERLVKAALK
jgi:predicted AlkP superfamily pyrophosphatase or phosphodiesterase